MRRDGQDDFEALCAADGYTPTQIAGLLRQVTIKIHQVDDDRSSRDFLTEVAAKNGLLVVPTSRPELE